MSNSFNPLIHIWVNQKSFKPDTAVYKKKKKRYLGYFKYQTWKIMSTHEAKTDTSLNRNIRDSRN